MASSRFQAQVETIYGFAVIRLPASESAKLPSRGQVSVMGTLNGLPLQTVLEPDGRSGHWMRLDPGWEAASRVKAGQHAELEIEPTTNWPEPTVPADLELALASAPEEVRFAWHEITPMARWEWVRWVNATRSPDTRRRRVEVSISKLKSGKRRPCCFDLSACTDPQLSRNGVLVASD
jgi:hypothetical protein